MYLPTDLYKTNDGKPVKVELLKSLYGLKQAGEKWNTHLYELFIKNNFKRSIHDKCVYIYINNETNSKTFICVCVDDIFIVGNNQIEINNLIDKLKNQLTKLSILGEIQKYVGINFTRDRPNGKLTLAQSQQLLNLYYTFKH
jgi:hypothetical protein